jgi:hypothetical protein
MSFRNALLAASLLVAPAALAQPVTGPYISLDAGVGYLQNQHLHSFSTPAFGTEVSGQVRTNVGGLAGAAIGYGLGNGFRVELEGDWGADKVYHFANGMGNGYQEQYHGFLNALYDFDLAPFGLPLAPYLGVGGGYGASHFTNIGQFGFNPVTGNANFIRSTGSADDYAVQGIAGFAFNVGAVPGLALTAEYRFTAQPSNQTYNGQYLEAGTSSRTHIQNDGLYNHEALLGAAARSPAGRGTRPHLPGILRLGSCGPDGTRPPDRVRSRRRFHARADHTHRSERLHRSVRHRSLQPASLCPARRERGSRAGA